MSQDPSRIEQSETNIDNRLSNHLPRGVKMLAIWGMFMGIASTMIYSQLAMFLKHELHATSMNIAMFDGFVELLSNITRIFAGTISDFMMNRKSVLLFGCIFSILIKPLFMTAHSIYTLLIAQSLDRITNGMQASPRDAFIADLTPPERRGQAYGLSRSLKTVGSFVGTLSAITLLAIFGDFQYRTVFICAFIPAIIALMILWKIKENAKVSDIISKKNKEKFKNPFTKKALKSLNWNFWKIMLFVGLFEMAHFSDALISVRANDFTGATYATFSSVFINLGQIICAYPLGVLSDRFSKPLFLQICVGMMLFSNLALLCATSFSLVAVGAFLWGGQMSGAQSLFLSMISETIDKHLRGTAVGVFFLISGAAYMAASCIAGLFWNINNKFAFLYSIVICILCLGTFRFFFKNKKNKSAA